MLVGNIFDSPCHCGKERILYVRYDQANDAAPLYAQAAGNPAGTVTKRLHRIQYPLAQIFADVGFARQHTRNGGGRNASFPRDIFDFCSHARKLPREFKRINNKVIDFLRAVNRSFRRFKAGSAVETGHNLTKAFSENWGLPGVKPLSAPKSSLAEKLVQRCHWSAGAGAISAIHPFAARRSSTQKK
jgi:hypothetical protein